MLRGKRQTQHAGTSGGHFLGKIIFIVGKLAAELPANFCLPRGRASPAGCYSRHISRCRSWNGRHIFLQAVLLSAAQFAGQPLLYRLLSCTQFRGAGVGIPRTVYGGRGCYRQHNFGAVCIAGQKKWLLSGAQFGLFSEGGRLLSTAQFARWVKFDYCYRQHISEFRLLSKRVRTGLLSSAHFRQWGCYRAHSFQTVEFWRLLLSTAHF